MYSKNAFPDIHIECVEREARYIPPLMVMCLESLAHLLVMLNFSSNFLVIVATKPFNYCSLKYFPRFKYIIHKILFYDNIVKLTFWLKRYIFEIAIYLTIQAKSSSKSIRGNHVPKVYATVSPQFKSSLLKLCKTFLGLKNT